MRYSICCLLFFTPLICANADELIGSVYDNETTEFLYQERHVFDQNKMQSFYTNAQGEIIGEREVEFSDDRVTAYRLMQAELKRLESVERKPEEITILAKNKDQVKEANVSHKHIDEVVIDAGFSNFILRHWAALTTGEKVALDFVSIAQLGVVKLQLKKVDVEKSSLTKYGSTDGVVMFNMNIANPLLRLLLKPIEIGYYEDTRQLAYYQGISNLKDADGKQFESVHIKFDRQTGQATAAAE